MKLRPPLNAVKLERLNNSFDFLHFFVSRVRTFVSE